ncbi:MAG: hypothetical protein QNJ31_08870 [Candidatus Caenarcaniphilales bacterium]|nr:hypothetical protein [Candidatus Caenarcaniphilales bacterium]
MVILEINQTSILKNKNTQKTLSGKNFVVDANFLLAWQAQKTLVHKTFATAKKNSCATSKVKCNR